jgi:hypothetical protein
MRASSGKDVDFARRQIFVREAKGGKDLGNGVVSAMLWGAHASPRAISGVPPEGPCFGETPNITREDAYAPQTPRGSL